MNEGAPPVWGQEMIQRGGPCGRPACMPVRRPGWRTGRAGRLERKQRLSRPCRAGGIRKILTQGKAEPGGEAVALGLPLPFFPLPFWGRGQGVGIGEGMDHLHHRAVPNGVKISGLYAVTRKAGYRHRFALSLMAESGWLTQIGCQSPFFARPPFTRRVVGNARRLACRLHALP